ncbi:MAG: AtpZ/AtpI family protein [Deltaproteobacteria bacterium]|nr:AtpZ/AtpI family protein [Deltaproteobacteria bacterium]
MKGYQIGRKQKTTREPFHKFSGILMLSAWGFATVLSSFLFLYIGYIVDEILGTTPNFMLCSFLLAVGLCIWTLYKDAVKKGKDL